MRRVLLGTAAFVVLAAASYACGGDDSTDTTVPSPDAGSTSSGASSSGKSSSGSTTSSSGASSSGSTTSSSGASSSGASSSGASSSGSTSGQSTTGGTPPPDDAGTEDASAIPDSGPANDAAVFDGGAGSKCEGGSIQESEVNDGKDQADVIPGETGSFCGTASAIDGDWITFTLPQDVASFSMGVDATGSLNVEGSVNDNAPGGTTGQKFQLVGPEAGSFPIIPGGTYYLHVTSTDVLPSSYIIGLTVKHQPASSVCAADSQKEVEDNGTTPNTIPGTTGSFCGTVNTTSDVDKVSFTLPNDATSLVIAYTTTNTGFSLQLDAGGDTYSLTSPPPGTQIPFHPGAVYTLTATSTTADNGYRINVTINP